MTISTEALEDAVAPLAGLAERLKAAAESADPDIALLSEITSRIVDAVSRAASLAA